jgi:HTH-type transcriptional regulator/antitoxin HipB
MNDLARDPKQIGNLIRCARKRQALSQTALGDKAGLRQETISLMENGNPATKIETILAVLADLDLELRIKRKDGIFMTGTRRQKRQNAVPEFARD